MNMRYDQIQSEVKEISLLMADSKEGIPGFLSVVKPLIVPPVIYFFFYFLCPFFDVFVTNIWQAAGVFSLAFWFFVSFFIYGYILLFSMLPKGTVEKYQILKVLYGKLKVYYGLWILSIVVAGLMSIFTIFNIISLSLISLLSTIVLGLAFNVDISRYQISGLFGAVAAAKEKLTN